MGFFSWRCAKTNKPVMAETAVKGTPWEFASRAVVLYRDGSKITGRYDGYGRIIHPTGEEIELTEMAEEKWRIIIEQYYKGERFEDFPTKNAWDRGQGFFYDDAELEQEFGVAE
jgi:hypothetical protein